MVLFQTVQIRFPRLFSLNRLTSRLRAGTAGCSAGSVAWRPSRRGDFYCQEPAIRQKNTAARILPTSSDRPSFFEGYAPRRKAFSTASQQGSIMANDRLPDGHDWSHREVRIEGKLFSHRHCKDCGRDFVMQSSLGQWTAVHVSIFGFATLADSINMRWLSQICPGHRLPEDRNEFRVPKSGSV